MRVQGIGEIVKWDMKEGKWETGNGDRKLMGDIQKGMNK